MTHLRPMRWWDIEPVMVIERAVFESTAWSAEMFWSELAARPDTRSYIVGEQDGQVIGYAGLMTLGVEADVQTIAVSPTSHRQGLGTKLLAEVEAEAVRRGCTRLLLEVTEDNAPAQSLYARSGFDAIARRPDYYGPHRDALVMEKRLAGRSRSG